MAPPCLHLRLPQTLLALPPRPSPSRPLFFLPRVVASPVRRRGRVALLRPVAALGWGGGGELLGRVEAFLYTVADAAVVAEGAAKEAAAGDWLSGITASMETVLKVLKDGLSTLHIPYPYGFAIILLTVLIKGATFPLTKKQCTCRGRICFSRSAHTIRHSSGHFEAYINMEICRMVSAPGPQPYQGSSLATRCPTSTLLPRALPKSSSTSYACTRTWKVDDISHASKKHLEQLYATSMTYQQFHQDVAEKAQRHTNTVG